MVAAKEDDAGRGFLVQGPDAADDPGRVGPAVDVVADEEERVAGAEDRQARQQRLEALQVPVHVTDSQSSARPPSSFRGADDTGGRAKEHVRPGGAPGILRAPAAC